MIGGASGNGGKWEEAWKWGEWKVEEEFRTFLKFNRKVVLLPNETHAFVACPRCGKPARVKCAEKMPLLLCPGALS
jgi:hypothetical protein